MVVALRRIGRRAGAARAETVRAIAEQVSGPDEGTRADSGVFTDRHVEALAAADATHWWFRSKAAFVSSALRRVRPPEGRLVDLGGGAGGVTSATGWAADDCVVVEGARELVEVARKRRGLDAVCANVDAAPIATGIASVVCLLDVIEHLVEPLPALREAARSLRTDGVLVVTVPAHPALWSAADEALGHVRRYTRAGLADDLGRAGFEMTFCSHVFSWLAIPVWFQRRMRSTGRAELGLDVASTFVDRAALVLTSIERLLVLRAGVTLPVGTSIIAVARPAPAR
jgi:SAM-dependent methyltransferase